MGRVRTALLVSLGLVSLLVAFAAPLRAEPPGWPWHVQQPASGTWGGFRSDLEAAGVTPVLNYTADIQGNPLGGESQGVAYAAWVYGSLTFDMQKLAGIEGLSIFAAGAWDQGSNLSETHIGNVFTVGQIFMGRSLRLAQVYLQQVFWDERATVKLGRLTSGQEFATLASFNYYLSAGINGNPFAIPLNVPAFFPPPMAQWGVMARLEPGEGFYLQAGAYNADPSVRADDANGIDFVFNPQDGLLTIGQVGLRRDPGRGEPGLPGHVALGGFFDSSAYDRLEGPGQERGNYGFYLMGEQMLYREQAAPSPQGLSAWAALTVLPDQEINTMPFAGYGGLQYRGLFEGRPEDVTAVGFYYGAFSRDLVGQDQEAVLEVNHHFRLAPWLRIAPDFQYVFNPAGTGDIANAAVFGTEITIDF